MATAYALTSARFPDGTTVAANAVGQRDEAVSAVVVNGTAAFSGLREYQEYVAHATVGGRYESVSFTTDGGPDSAQSGSLPDGGPGVLTREEEDGTPAWVEVVEIDAAAIPFDPPDRWTAVTVQDAIEEAPSHAEGGGSTPDATESVKGKILLAGDLGGSAESPTVPGLADKADVSALASKADASDLSDHEGATEGVHGIEDTADLIVEGDPRLADSRAPSGAAGGVLSGSYPDPGFAADMATQAELDAHASDGTDVHGIPATGALVAAIKWDTDHWEFDGATVTERPALPSGGLAIWSGGQLENDPSDLMAVHDVWFPHEAPE